MRFGLHLPVQRKTTGEVGVIYHEIRSHKKRAKFAERTLAAFSNTLLDCLKSKPLEELTVNDLCTATNYPRATFYNYFDDIYDLLNHCWIRIAEDIAIDDFSALRDEERTEVLFERCYSFLRNYEESVEKILRHNPEGGRFQESLRCFIRKHIYIIIQNCPCCVKYQVPAEMIAEHYSNTIEMLLEWCFVRKNRLKKENALTALDYLLGGL